jgi:hypothetical protein
MDVTTEVATVASLARAAIIEDGRSFASVAKKLGHSKQTFHNRLKNNGLSAEDLLQLAELLHRPESDFNPRRAA